MLIITFTIKYFTKKEEVSMSKVYQEFIYKRTYSRYIDDQERRETWDETVSRYEQFFQSRVPNDQRLEFKSAIEAVKRMEVMPSMRALWTAGEALERENVCGFNCSYLTIDNPRAFAEVAYILMCGAGVGFSVERQYVNQLPKVPESLVQGDKPIVFADSKLGWAEGLNQYVGALYKGYYRPYDLSRIRPKGARLKTFGGRASGPEPLKQLLEFTFQLFNAARGRRLNSLECHDLVCMIANIVVVGGVRRSATISLSNPSDTRMAHAKDGEFWKTNPHRMLANNSIAYTEKPDAATFMDEWLNLMRSNSGERGIFNRESASFIAGLSGRRDVGHEFGCNPCSEIILRPYQFCNLSEVVVREGDDLKTLKRKVRQATILGILQSTLTDFNFLNKKWKENTEEERLLGVSLTGLRDHKVLGRQSEQAENFLKAMKQEALLTAEEWSKALDINMPAAITCVKPSGTVSQLVECASGLHPRYSPYYIRRVRVAANDPIATLLEESGLDFEPEVGQTRENCSTKVYSFPIKSPESAVMRDQASAMEQLEYWKMLQVQWCEQKPSCTIYVKPDEWIEVGAWIFKNWDYVSGISFLPHDGGVYQLAPYQEISAQQYEELRAKLPAIDFEKLTVYEKEDHTKGGQELACAGGSCELH